MPDNIFFIIGCARSATTTIARVLGKATNAEVFTEQDPKLCFESRELFEGRLGNPKQVLFNAKNEKISETLAKGLIYGDKNPNYLPFIPYAEELWNPRYLFIVRDGRETVRSMMDWHELSHGNIFGMHEDDPSSGFTAWEQDWWDYSRPRPKRGEKYFDVWQRLSRFEKCAWYWNKFNTLLLSYTETLDPARWKMVNMNKLSIPELEEIFTFLHLRKENKVDLQTLLTSKINSPKDRYGMENKFPHWKNWDAALLQQFNQQASKMMAAFNYQ